MRTTLKRGVGRGAGLNGKNGHAVLPPTAVSSVVRYRGRRTPRTGLGSARPDPARRRCSRVVAVGLAVAGGAVLWFHESLSDVRAHSVDVKVAQKQLNVTLPGHAAIALVIGYDQRAGAEYSNISRSDTVMLVRADPATNTISLLSIPRDLGVPIYCPKWGGDQPRRRPGQPGVRGLRLSRDARHGQALHGPPDQLPRQGQLPRLQGARGQDRRDLARRRPSLLPRQQRHGRRELREHQPPAGLPAADGRSRRSTSSATATPTTTTTASRASSSSCGR